MNYKLLFSGMFLLTSLLTQAQSITKGAVFTTGGAFMQPGNVVEVGYYQSDSNSAILLDTVLGDFSNAVAQKGQFLYAHIGRSSSHPLGGDRIYRYDLINGSVIDSTGMIPGVQRMTIAGDYLVVTFGFGTTDTSYVRFFDRYDLSNIVLADNTIPVFTSGIDSYDSVVYVGYTLNDTGMIAVYQTNPIAYTGSFTLDTLSAGISDVFVDANQLVCTSTRFDFMFNFMYSGVTRLLLADSSFVTDTSAVAMSAFALEGDLLYGNFGNPVQTRNVITAQETDLFPYLYSAGAKDPNDTLLFLQQTDYFSFGSFEVVSTSGVNVFSTGTNFSGSALSAVINHVPETETGYYGTFSDGTYQDSITINILNHTSDMDGDSLFMLNIVRAPLFGDLQVVGDSIHYKYTGNFPGVFDTIVYSVADVWGDSATGIIEIYNEIEGIEENLFSSTISVFPNPAKDLITIQLQDIRKPEAVMMLDMQGRLIRTEKLEREFTRIAVSDLPKGVYILEIRADGKVGHKKFIKK